MRRAGRSPTSSSPTTSSRAAMAPAPSRRYRRSRQPREARSGAGTSRSGITSRPPFVTPGTRGPRERATIFPSRLIWNASSQLPTPRMRFRSLRRSCRSPSPCPARHRAGFRCRPSCSWVRRGTALSGAWPVSTDQRTGSARWCRATPETNAPESGATPPAPARKPGWWHPPPPPGCCFDVFFYPEDERNARAARRTSFA